ncbi:MAG: hypothetical protein ACJ796_20855 [Gemmatimonadaceae bacterium]
MSRRLAALRIVLAAAAISALAACASPTAPTSHLRVPSVNRDGATDGTPSDCRSGYSLSQGRSC